MDTSLWVAVIVALAVGVFLGVIVSSLRFMRLERARRATLGAAAGIARIGHEALPVRSAADILSGRIQIVLQFLGRVLLVLFGKLHNVLHFPLSHHVHSLQTIVDERLLLLWISWKRRSNRWCRSRGRRWFAGKSSCRRTLLRHFANVGRLLPQQC